MTGSISKNMINLGWVCRDFVFNFPDKVRFFLYIGNYIEERQGLAAQDAILPDRLVGQRLAVLGMSAYPSVVTRAQF